MKKKSYFIVIEGLDGSGKTTATRTVTNVLEYENHGRVKLTFEPHDPSCSGLFIRQVLMKKIRTPNPKLLALAFAANRLDHCDREINKWLDEKGGRILICDRYYLSSLVYQSVGNLTFESVYELNSEARKPDLIIFLNVSNRVCYERMKNRNEDKELFEKNLGQTRKDYLDAIKFLKNKGDNIVEIDASGTLEEVSELILQEIYKLDSSLKPKSLFHSSQLTPKIPWITTTEDGDLPTDLVTEAKKLGIIDKIGKLDKDEIVEYIENKIDSYHFNLLGALFLDHIKLMKIEVIDKLPWTELDAFQLEYKMPGDLILRGVALIIQEKQRYDILIKKAPKIPNFSDFMFIFSPGPSELVNKYYERDQLVYDTNILKEGLFPATQAVTQKAIAESIYKVAGEISWEISKRKMVVEKNVHNQEVLVSEK